MLIKHMEEENSLSNECETVDYKNVAIKLLRNE